MSNKSRKNSEAGPAVLALTLAFGFAWLSLFAWAACWPVVTAGDLSAAEFATWAMGLLAAALLGGLAFGLLIVAANFATGDTSDDDGEED